MFEQKQRVNWSEREDLNLRPLVSQFDFLVFLTLPTIGLRHKNMKDQSLIFPFVAQAMLPFLLRWRPGGDSQRKSCRTSNLDEEPLRGFHWL